MRFFMRCLLMVPLALAAGGLAGCKDTNAAVAKMFCDPCGVVESIVTREIKPDGTGKGAVAGAIVGGVIGHQFGSGKGNDAATVVGAGAGAVAGNEIEKEMNKRLEYDVTVRMDDGARRVFTFDTPPELKQGDKVEVKGNVIERA